MAKYTFFSLILHSLLAVTQFTQAKNPFSPFPKSKLSMDGSSALFLQDDTLILSRAPGNETHNHWNLPPGQFTTSSNHGHFSSATARWLGKKGSKGINSGSHYWTITFTNVPYSQEAAVGLTNRTMFRKNGGLIYNGNLINGMDHHLLVPNFGPGIPAGDSVMGILAFYPISKNSAAKRLKIYLYENGTPLGLAFDVPASALPNANPLVHFPSGGGGGGGGGEAKIQKQISVPALRHPVQQKWEGIEGNWKVIHNSVVLGGVADWRVFKASSSSSFKESVIINDIRIKIRRVHGQRYTVRCVVGDNSVMRSASNNNSKIYFEIEKTQKTWRPAGKSLPPRPSSSPLMIGGRGGDDDETQKSQWVVKMIFDLTTLPDHVSVSRHMKMTIVRGKSRAIFARFDDTVGPFVGDPWTPPPPRPGHIQKP